MSNCYTTKELSEMLGISAGKLATERMKGKGIPFVKIGGAVRYRKKDVESYLENNLRRTVADK